MAHEPEATEATAGSRPLPQPPEGPPGEPPRPAALGEPPRPAAALHRTVIRPTSGWQLVDLRELWKYRELLVTLCWRDVKVRYKQTALGAAWAVLQPAMMMLVFTVVFGKIAAVPTGDELPKPLFYLSGLLPWFFFTSAMVSSANSVLGSEHLISKIYFPRLIVPLAAVGSAIVDFFVACGLLAVLLLGFGLFTGTWVQPGWQILLAPAVAGVVVVLAAGLGIGFAALNVSFRDFRYVLPFLVQLGMYGTPTIYMDVSGKTGLIQAALAINPMASLVTAFRSSITGGEVPWLGLAVAATLAVSILTFSCLYFRKVEDRFADIM